MKLNYTSANYLQFEQDFNKLYVGYQPLFVIADDIERVMNKGKPYFILPARQAVDGMRHVFCFEVAGDGYVFKGVYKQPPHT